jgi:hypothetical protein
MMRHSLTATAATALLFATPANAQSFVDSRVLVGASVGWQLTTTDFEEDVSFVDFVEDGSFDVEYEVGPGLVFDAGAVVRLWRYFGAGVAVSIFGATDEATVSLEAPHPFHFTQPRDFSATLELERREIGTHIQAVAMIPAGSRVQILVSGGPSIIHAEQELAVEVDFSELFPFDELVNPRAVVASHSSTAVGFNVGADVSVFIGPRWGVGGLVRFAHASTDLEIPATGLPARDLRIDVGGVQVAGGVRFAF